MRATVLVRRIRLACWCAIGLATCVIATSAGSLCHADVVDADDFEGLTLSAFTAATASAGDGTDWTDQIRTGTAREWTIDNSAMTGTTTELAYFGWTAMDIDSWIDEQGIQDEGVTNGGRDNIGGAGSNNTVLVADPDAWDDYTSGAATNGYTSFIQREYDLTGFDETTIEITMDYHFQSEDNQMGNIEVSFDGGSTWTTLAMFDSTAVPNNTIFKGVAGVDFFNVTGTSSNMLLKFGCFDSGNDWWFAVDNITVTTGDGFSDTEDFEGLTLQPFTDVVGDGTDFVEASALEAATGWVLDNSGNLGGCNEEAYDGLHAMDVASWIDEQGGQGRTLFALVDPNNTVIVGDGDAFYDYDFDFGDPGQPAPSQGLNSYLEKTYDVSGYDNCSLTISFEYEFRIENQQLGVAEVSFDDGATWQRVLELDNNDGANGDVLSNLATFTAGTDFNPRQTNRVMVRIGYLLADNNWWYAVDNIQVEADPIAYVKGDANQDGNVNTLDLSPFVNAIFNPTGYEATYGVPAVEVFDFNCDSNFNTQDIAGFVNILLNG